MFGEVQRREGHERLPWQVEDRPSRPLVQQVIDKVRERPPALRVARDVVTLRPIVRPAEAQVRDEPESTVPVGGDHPGSEGANSAPNA